MTTYGSFYLLYAANQLLLAVAVTLVAVWMCGFGGGPSWQSDPAREFRWHPLAMSLGMFFCNGEAILIYRGLRNVPKPKTKLMHAGLQFCAIIINVFGLKAAWDSHDLNKDKDGNLKPIPNLMSLHSWIGISTVVLFCLQFLFGFITYLKPGLPMQYRALFMPGHRLGGIALFVMALGSALMGISERSAWKMTCWTKEGYFCGEMLITNIFGVFLVAYAVTTLALVAYPDWIRKEPEALVRIPKSEETEALREE
uniref:Cytochrome b561 domain-containing protein n=1 Tax=Steinernema glaseri TaxID=37863 RepID=A0A1I8AJR7_9BILA